MDSFADAIDVRMRALDGTVTRQAMVIAFERVFALTGIMLALTRGRFQGRPGTRVFEGRTGRIEPEEATVLETDGEVCLARAMRFEHLAGALNVCAR